MASIQNNYKEIVDSFGFGIIDKFNKVDTQFKDKVNFSDLEVERKRIDSFTKLEEGSTTGDAELIDARVGADGVTYDNLGSAVRGQVNVLNSKLTLSEAIKTSKIMIDEIAGSNGYVDVNGVFQPTNSFVTTDYTILNDVVGINAYVRLYDTILSISYYDKNKIFISGQKGVSSTPTLLSAIIPPNAVYFRFSLLNTDPTQFVEVTTSSVIKNKNEILELNNICNNTISPSTIEVMIANIDGTNGYVDINGVFQPSGGWITTKAIPCNDILSIRIKVNQYNTVMYVSFYDEYQDFISGTIGEQGEVFNGLITIPSNAIYLKMSFITSITSQYYEITYDTLKSKFNKYNNDNNQLYNKIMTSTGDSISTTTSQRPYSGFAKMVALKNQMTFESKAIWGATLPLNEHSSGSILNTIQNMRSDADYIVLSGGVNDWYHIQAGREELGVITQGYDETLNTNTFYGALESMCKTSLEKWIGKKIIYVITHKPLDLSTEKLAIVDTYVEGMKKILNKWGIPFVDLYNTMPSLFLPYLKDLYTTNGNAIYNGVGDGLHPNKDGYITYYNPKVESLLKSI